MLLMLRSTLSSREKGSSFSEEEWRSLSPLKRHYFFLYIVLTKLCGNFDYNLLRVEIYPYQKSLSY